MFAWTDRSFLAGVLVVALASAATAQDRSAGPMHNATRLAGSTAFYGKALKSAASLREMVASRGMADDIRTVLRESGIPETADAVLALLSGATTSVRGGSCDDATPADGTIVECDFQPQSTLLWMAYRPNGRKGNRTPSRLDGVRWADKRPFRAYLFRITHDYKIFTFIVPAPCSNLSLKTIQEIAGEPVGISVDRVCDPKTGALRAAIQARIKDPARVRSVRVAVNGQPVVELTAPSWTFIATRPGDYTFEATDQQGRPHPMERRTLPVEACPPPPAEPVKEVVAPRCGIALSTLPISGGHQISIDATGSTTGTASVAPTITVVVRDETGTVVGQELPIGSSRTGQITVRRPGLYRATATVMTPRTVEEAAYRYEGSATCEASILIEKPAGPSIFLDVVGGKDRRQRPIGDTDLEFAQCSPLLGLKLGVAKRFSNNWELAGAVGGAISLVTNDRKVNESALFVDAELNKHLRASGAFFGTGLSVWDLTRSDTWTPAWLLHFGVPLMRRASHSVYFVGEGRLYLDHADDVANDYLVWGGVRVHFTR